MEANILTRLQQTVLTGVFESGIGERGWFFTGGSALAEFYLRHRQSDDPDFFTRKQSIVKDDADYLHDCLESLRLSVTRERLSDTFVRFFVADSAAEHAPLKIEFAADVAGQIAPLLPRGRIRVDSFEDIAVNKICAIFGRTDPKDYVDLYFILRESSWSLDHLIAQARMKEAAFDDSWGALMFASRLLQVESVRMLPRMVKPLELDDLRSHLGAEARRLLRVLAPRGRDQ